MDDIARLREELDTAVAEFDGGAVRALAERLAAQLEAHLEGHVVEHPQALCATLRQSLAAFDDERTASLCRDLVVHLRGREEPYPPERAAELLGLLRRKRHFPEVLDVADALIRQGCSGAKIRRLYAQALIDVGHLSAAIDVLSRLEAQCLEADGEHESEHAHELGEARGLLGRAWKQIYCDGTGTGSRRRQALEKAERCYAGEFRRDARLLWHGINGVALQQRARRDGLADYAPSTGPISGRDILALAGVTGGATGDRSGGNDTANGAPNAVGPAGGDARAVAEVDVWTRATLAEACLAEGDFPQALRWIVRYVEKDGSGEPAADAFEVASTLRQFEEVWQLDIEEPAHARILEVLRSALLDREGGSVAVADVRSESATIDTLLEDDAFEQLLGRERFRNLRWYRSGLERARSVCKVVDTHGEGIGSGFLVQTEDLGVAHETRWMVLTNAHVVSASAEEQGGVPAAMPPEAAFVRFEASDEPERCFRVTGVLATSPRQKLDFSVLALDGAGDFPEPCPIARRLPLVDRNQRIYVIGHPRGGGIAFSLNDNLLLDHEAPKVHYRSPTEGGSSGSPLFNQNWELIGLHHAGGLEMPRLNGQSGRYPANEGLWIQSIRAAIASNAAG